MTYLVDGLQRVGFRGEGLSGSLWLDIAGLIVWWIAATAVAARTWRWE